MSVFAAASVYTRSVSPIRGPSFASAGRSPQEAHAASPTSAWAVDGFGETPRDVALALLGRLEAAGDEGRARSLRAFLAERGLKLEG